MSHSADPRGAPDNPVDVVTVVRKARFVGAYAKMSLAPGIPIDIHAEAVSIRTASPPETTTDDVINEDPVSIARDDASISGLFLFYHFLLCVHPYIMNCCLSIIFWQPSYLLSFLFCY